MDTKGMTLADRIEHHRQMAESYHAAYLKHDVEEGTTYKEWTFAPHAEYWSAGRCPTARCLSSSETIDLIKL